MLAWKVRRVGRGGGGGGLFNKGGPHLCLFPAALCVPFLNEADSDQQSHNIVLHRSMRETNCHVTRRGLAGLDRGVWGGGGGSKGLLLGLQVVDVWSGGTSVFTNVVGVVTVVMGLHTRSFTWIHWLFYVVCSDPPLLPAPPHEPHWPPPLGFNQQTLVACQLAWCEPQPQPSSSLSPSPRPTSILREQI